MKEKSDWFHARYSDNVTFSIRIRDRVYSNQGNFQKIEVMDSFEFGRVLVLDDIINVTERDEFIYHEMLAHVPLFSHTDPKNILVVGGGDGGIIREITKHASVERACLVEIDSKVVEVSKQYFPGVSKCFDDQRVSIIYNDASEFVKSKKNEFDVIIVDSTDPIGAGERLFNLEFYQDCFNVLTGNGILTAQSESPFFDPDITERLYKNAKEVFPVVKIYIAFMPSYVSGIWSFLYCSKKYDPIDNFQAERLNQACFETKYYNSEIHKASFALPSFLKKQLNIYSPQRRKVR
jgi:spermidine synthase